MSLVVPGWGQVYNGKFAVGLLFQFTLLAVGLSLCWSRTILEPLAIVLFASFVVGVHVVSFGMQLKSNFKVTMAKSRTIAAVLFPVVFVGLALGIYYYREEWLGVGLYHIPTRSMEPSLQPGDIVIVDTWAYRESAAKLGDVVLFIKPTTRHEYLVKRVEKATENSSLISKRYFLTGDNLNQSSDSRHFGWVKHNFLRGRATSILLAIREGRVSLSSQGRIPDRIEFSL